MRGYAERVVRFLIMGSLLVVAVFAGLAWLLYLFIGWAVNYFA